jgi:D-alanyl-D-alanine carboxypeptidase
MNTFADNFTYKHFLSVIVLIIGFNVNAAPIPKAPNPDVKSYILIDYDSGMVIAEKNADLILPQLVLQKS